MKKVFFIIGLIILAIAIFFILFEIHYFTTKNQYNYIGYITDIFENKKGETVLVTLSGTKESTFTVKPYTIISAPAKQNFPVGSRIKLSTTYFSKTNISKIQVGVGYSTTGKIIYTEEQANPFILVTLKDFKTVLVNVTAEENEIFEGLKTGDTVIFYHKEPLLWNLKSITLFINAESRLILSKASAEPLTSEEIEFIKSKGYNIK